MAVENEFRRLALVANPGSASRKYALFNGEKLLAELHFEYENGQVVCTLSTSGTKQKVDTDLTDITAAANYVMPVLNDYRILPSGTVVKHIGLRVVAPTSFFLEDRVITGHIIKKLEQIKSRAPLHIEATLSELRLLNERFADATIAGVSDSGFHKTKPDFAWVYGLPIKDADHLDIKRFGYHGLSAESVVQTLKDSGDLPQKLIICHLGSGASVTAVKNGRSIDTTMGYSPLEGLVMATRAGTLDSTAVRVLKQELGLNDSQLETYLNKKSGLLGLSGISSDIRVLLQKEHEGNHYARLALRAYVYNVQKAIGQMAAVLDGADTLVFTGTVGERSAPMRSRIVKNLSYLNFTLNTEANQKCTSPTKPTTLSRHARIKPVIAIPANEARQIARHTLNT